MNIQREAVAHPDRSIRFLNFEQASFSGPRHRHRHLELTWIVRGQGLRSVGSVVSPFFDGDLVLLGPQVPHQWSSRNSPGPARCEAVVLQFAPDWLEAAQWPERAALGPMLRRATRGLQVGGKTHAAVTTALARMIDVSPLRQVAACLDTLALLAEGADDLQPLLDGSELPPVIEAAEGAPRQRRIDRVLDWVHRDLAHTLTVAQAASLAHVTPAAFGRWFRREVGKGFVEYVNDARCGAACLRLLQGADPIAVIAQDCGFATLSNFNAQFRRRHGMAPRAWRRAPS
jgi:AraC-like DNA-binding protein